MLVSLIVPCYNEQEVLPVFRKETSAVVEKLKEQYGCSFEYILVDDGSKDGTLSYMKSWNEEDPSVHYISFSRNFGKEAALYAGLSSAKGDYIAVMDADLQDPPEMLGEMLEVLTNEDYDIAAARRTSREGEPPIRSFFADRFYELMNHSSRAKMENGARDFRLMKRCVVDAVLSMGEYNRFSKGIFSWVGFKTKWLDYTHVDRAKGTTKWSFWSLFSYAIDGIVGFSTSPLLFAAYLGLFMFIISIIGILFIIVRRLLFYEPVKGWASLACIILFCSGVQLLCIGIIGEYLAKTYLEVKHRPIYLVRESDIEKEED